MVTKNQIVITGANGFVARHLRKIFSENNIKLISIARKNFKEFKNETKIISKSYDEKTILSKIKNSQALIHLVGTGNQTVETNYELVNTEYTKHIVDLCKKAGIKKIIYASGLGVSAKTPLAYFISKYKAERSIVSSGIDYTIFRPSYIVGKDDLFTKFLKKQIGIGKIEIPGSGLYSIQPIFINDVVEIFFQSLTNQKFHNKILDLVGPEEITFEKYVKLFSKGTKTKIKKINLETVYFNAITNPKSDFGVDDLNILIGNFKGNHKILRKISNVDFHSITELLKSGSLL